jgi:hypothetical protein
VIPVCMHVVRLAPVTHAPVYCAAPADTSLRCIVHRVHAAQVQQLNSSTSDAVKCRRCDAPVVDDGSFYECAVCGDTDLVAS